MFYNLLQVLLQICYDIVDLFAVIFRELVLIGSRRSSF